MSSPSFRKYQRLAQAMKRLKGGLMLLKLDKQTGQYCQTWFQLDEHLSYLSWTDITTKNTSRVFVSDLLDIKQEDKEGLPAFCVSTRDISIEGICPSWREFEIFFQVISVLISPDVNDPTSWPSSDSPTSHDRVDGAVAAERMDVLRRKLAEHRTILDALMLQNRRLLDMASLKYAADDDNFTGPQSKERELVQMREKVAKLRELVRLKDAVIEQALRLLYLRASAEVTGRT